MTKKDYILLASALESAYVRTSREPLARDTFANVLDEIMDVLESDNPRFNRGTFLAAVYGSDK